MPHRGALPDRTPRQPALRLLLTPPVNPRAMPLTLTNPPLPLALTLALPHLLTPSRHEAPKPILITQPRPSEEPILAASRHCTRREINPMLRHTLTIR